MDRDEFRGAVRRWFEVEAYDDGQLDELAERVEEQLDELGYSVGELFDADARDVAEGLAWFEERERAIIAGERSDELGELDLALMLLTAIGMEPPAPAARANRPAWLCGEWELAASPGAKRAATRRWCFEPDGSCATSPSGRIAPDVSWLVHYQGGPTIWLVTGDELDLQDVLAVRIEGEDRIELLDRSCSDDYLPYQRTTPSTRR